MRTRSETRHVIDLIFPIALFFVLAASSLAAVLLASNVYRHTVQAEQSNFESRTSLSYVAWKVRQNDESGAVSIGTFDGQDSLVMKQFYDGQEYRTYIYEYDGYLRELVVRADVEANAAAGRKILEVQDFQMEEFGDGIFRFSYVGEDGKQVSTMAAVRSE